MTTDVFHVVCICLGVVGVISLIVVLAKLIKSPTQQIHNLDVRLLSLAQQQALWKEQTEQTHKTILDQGKEDRENQDKFNHTVLGILDSLVALSKKQYSILSNNYCILQDCPKRKPKIGNYYDPEFTELMEKVDGLPTARKN